MEFQRCEVCSFENPPEARFCQQCGSSFAALGGVDSPTAEPDGERKPVTILFTDIVGSTSMAEKLDPEEWKAIVSGAHRIVGEAVRRYEGTVAQLLGDGVLVFFGAPLIHEDDPQRAVRAAVEIQGALQDYRRELRGMVVDFQMRIGIHIGIVVVGPMGDGEHVEYLAVGDAVNLAARLQSAASPGGVLVSQTVARRVSPICELQDLGEISLKGKGAPVRVYQVGDLKQGVDEGRGIAGLQAPLVGRQSELSVLKSSLAELEAGRGGIIFILGEAGIGKSRLVEEVRRTASPQIRWLEGRSLSYGAARSYWAVIHLLLQDLELSDAAPEPRIRVALNRRIHELFDARRDDYTPYLYHLLGLRQAPEIAEKLAQLSAETLKRQVLVTLTAYFSALAELQPLVLVFEDLHWAEDSSLEVLERLFPAAAHIPLLLICLARPERQHGSWRLKRDAGEYFSENFTEIHLKQLSDRESEDLVSELLDSSGLLASLCRQILEQADGNPFYIEEILGSLIDRGQLVRSEIGWQLTGEIDQIEIPDTLEGVLLARIDSLAEDVRQTLQMASVIGRSFLYRLLQAISQAELELDWHLAQLQRFDLVREKTRRPEREYIFKHTLTQEAAYSSLLVERRQKYHLLTAQALERLFSDRIDEFSGMLAYHYATAGERGKALAYFLQSGDKARLENAFAEAKAMYRRGIELLEELGDREGLSKTWLKLGLLHQSEFAFEAAHHAYEQAFALQQGIRKGPLKQPSVDRLLSSQTVLQVGIISANPEIVVDLDPGNIAGPPVTCEFIPSLFAGLAECDFESNVVPHLARSWEVFDGGRTYLFHLRDDAFWTDGHPITAADFEWAWKRNLAPGRPEYPANLLDDVTGARLYRKGEKPDPDRIGVRALDELTLEVRLDSPVPYFIYLTAFPVTFPLPAHIVDHYGKDWWKPPNGVYNGPFRMVEYSTYGFRLERNPHYFSDFPGNLDEITVYFGSGDAPQLWKRFLEQDLDILTPGASLNSTAALPPDRKFPRRYINIHALLFNPCLPPLDDRCVRQALAQGLDFKRFVETSDYCSNLQWKGGSGGLVPPSMPGHSLELGLPFDLPKARRLLAEAGFPEGKGFPKLKFRTIKEQKVPVELINQLEDHLGIQSEIQIAQRESELIPSRETNLDIVGWIVDYPDPSNILSQSSFIRFLNNAGWKHPRYFELIKAAGKNIDQNRRMALYREADRILVDEEMLVVPISYGYRKNPVLVNPGVSGCGWDVFAHLNYKNILLERKA